MRTILCLILFCLQEEPLSSKQGGCAGRPQRAGQAGAADGGWEEPGANVGAGGQGEDLQEADRGGGGDRSAEPGQKLVEVLR